MKQNIKMWIKLVTGLVLSLCIVLPIYVLYNIQTLTLNILTKVINWLFADAIAYTTPTPTKNVITTREPATGDKQIING